MFIRVVSLALGHIIVRVPVNNPKNIGKRDSYAETEILSSWWNFHHWLHTKLLFWQLSVQPVKKISLKMIIFSFQCRFQCCTAWINTYVGKLDHRFPQWWLVTTWQYIIDEMNTDIWEITHGIPLKRKRLFEGIFTHWLYRTNIVILTTFGGANHENTVKWQHFRFSVIFSDDVHS